jgi:hypothetical protein
MKLLHIDWIDTPRRGRCLDFLISGKSLLKMLKDRGYQQEARLGTALVPTDVIFRDELTLAVPGPLPSGRVPLYICPCGDYDCGVIAVRISHSGDSFLWNEFAWEDHSNEVTIVKNLGPFRFQDEQYRKALGAIS